MININNRLLKISDFCLKEDKILDIGCDHALLEIYMTQQGFNIVGSDINKGPLEKAKLNIQKYNQEVELRLGNGLETLKDEDTIIISGMGGLTIIEILKTIPEQIKKIIISPNTDFKETRKHLTNNNFKLEKEVLVKENNKFYLISVYERGKNKINYEFGILENNEITKEYYTNIINKNNMICSNLSNKQILKKIKLKLQNIRIKRKINI